MLWNFQKPKAFESDWPLVDTPVPVALILLSYAFFALKCGKLFMQKRQPYNVKNVMLVYNVVQVIYNSLLFIVSMKYMMLPDTYNLSCMESLPLQHPMKIYEMALSYGYLINKILDLTDTIFFVLRKSYKQITLLHVYHHIGMVIAVYSSLRFYGSGGHFVVTGTLNSFVHVVMYAYYFIAAQSTRVRGQLWWKRYITIMQMVQFLIIFLHTLLTFCTHACGFPRVWLWVAFSQSVIMMLMFAQFYVQAYMKPKRVQCKQQQQQQQQEVKQD